MAEAVEQALREKRHLIVEAGTGTGKTLAYLLPVIRSGKRVIISTGTKNLQEQLFFKDVPFLETALFQAQAAKGVSAEPSQAPGKFSVCYMKGRNNYLCRMKLYDLTDQPVLSGLGDRTISRDCGVGKDNGDRRPRGTCGTARGEPALAEA